MPTVAYLPNTEPKNNSTSQVRRRVNQTVSAVVQQGQQIAQLQAPRPATAVAPIKTSTTANAGGAAALPSAPAAYEIVEINGVQYKRPLYAL